jgi:hypothetical protein
MSDIAVLLKSYARDAEYARRLIGSFHEYNRDDLVLHCVVPKQDLGLFTPLTAGTVRIHAEEDLVGSHLINESVGEFGPGYINQEIVKLAFWETGLADNYFCVDSDAQFVRQFGTEDFMRDAKTPYTVLVEDNELKVEPQYFAQHWQGREQSIRRIMSEVGLEDPIMRTCHGHQVFSSLVLESLRDDFLTPRGWSYIDALRLSPYEFSWYAMWLQKTNAIPLHQREPLVKVLHTEEQCLEYVLRGITQDDVARGYLAMVVNSNFARNLGVRDLVGDKPAALAPHLSYGEALRLLGTKARLTWDRRVRDR